MKLLAYILMALATMAGSISAATAYLVPITAGVLDEQRLTGDPDAEEFNGITLAAPAGAFDPTTDEGEALVKTLNTLREAAQEKREAEAPEPLLKREPVTVDTPPLPEVDAADPGVKQVREREEIKPIAIKDEELTPQLLELLRENDVEFVKSASFDPTIWFGLWPSWVFVASVLVLLGSAMMVRAASKAPDKKAPEYGAAQEGGPQGVPTEPLAIAQAMRLEVEAVAQEVGATADGKRQLALIVDRLGEVQRTLVPAFAASRPTIISRMGMGGYAQVMDIFAASERAINRAWSAAADGHVEEARQSLILAENLIPGVEEKLA
jgi:hypothetical protein